MRENNLTKQSNINQNNNIIYIFEIDFQTVITSHKFKIEHHQQK